MAFWQAYSNKSDLLGELHFCREHLDIGTIIHECTHAALTYARRSWLNIESLSAEELLVQTHEQMVKEVKAFLHEARRKSPR